MVARLKFTVPERAALLSPDFDPVVILDGTFASGGRETGLLPRTGPEPQAPQTPLTGQHIVGVTNAGAQFAPAVAALPGSAYVIVWLDSQRGAIYGQLYDSAGARVGGEFQVSSPGPAPLFPSVAALDGGGFIVAWQYSSFDSADIHARRYDAAGSPTGAEFTVNSSLPNEQLDARVIGLDGGGFLFTWDTIAGDQYQEVSGRLYTSAGDPLGPDFTINTTTADAQGISSIAPLAGGGFVATWQSVTPAASGHVLLMGQLFAANGTKIGGEFQINTATANTPVGNDVVRLLDGTFVVSWIDPVPSNGGGRVVARHYNANGNPLSGEVVIASKSSGGFANSAVAALAGGGYVVSWTDKDAADNNVSARAMAADDRPLGAAFDVSAGAPFVSVLYPDGAVTLANGHVVFAWDGPSTNTSEDAYYRMYEIPGGAQGHLEGDSGDNNITGTSGVDYFDLSQGGNDTASGGDGNDGFYFGAAFTAADQVDGGAGTNDQIGLQGDYTGGNALTLGANTITDIEVIVVLAGFSYSITTVDANVAAGGVLSVQATQLAAGQSLTFNGAAETNGRFMIYGGQGDDNLTGGGGSDGFYFGPGGFNSSDLVNGGAGTNDQLGLDGNYAMALGGNFTNVEVVVLLPGPSGTPNTFNLSVADVFVPATQIRTIFGTQVTTNIIFNGANEHDGAFKIYGGSGNDTFTGGDGGDWVFGGGGGDTLTGGLGADIFFYDAVAQSTGTGFDQLIGFDDSVDTIDLPFAVLGLRAPVSGNLSSGTFDSDLATAFGGLGNHEAGMFTATGGDMSGRSFLIVDADGNAGYQAGSDYVIEIVSPLTPVDSPAIFV